MPEKRRFQPSMAATLATLVVVPAFISLGVWQLHRAEEKRELARLAAIGAESSVVLTAENANRLRRYQRVSVAGHYDAARQVLLDNMPSKGGAAGYRVLTPFVMSDAHIVLVDRGWVPLGRTRSELPTLELPPNPQAVTIAGTLDRLPAPGFRLGKTDPQASWPKVLSYPRYQDLSLLYGKGLLENIVLLDRTQPLGFEREWQHSQFGPERHIAYAVQWFGMALTVLVIYFVVNLKRSNLDE